MKNPMTPQQQCQAVMDNAAGHPMQFLSLYNRNLGWRDRTNKEPLNFFDYEYRRKPEPQKWYILEYKSGSIVTHKTYAGALLADSQDALIRVIRVIKDPDWVEPEDLSDCKINTLLSRICEHGTKSCEVVHDKPKDPNPWRPIIEGEWPECKPEDEIIRKLSNGEYDRYPAGMTNWNATAAIEWKYAEDE